jgi:hypothetical protein
MNSLRNFDLLRNSELWISRSGFSRRFYELTDGQFCYGIIDDAKDFLGIANDHWTFKKDEEWQGKTNFVRINNSRNERVGSITFDEITRDVILKMKNGFEARMIEKKSFGFTYTFIWTNAQYNTMVTIKPSNWNIMKPLSVTLNTDLVKKVPELSLMILFGTAFFILVRDNYSKLKLGLI